MLMVVNLGRCLAVNWPDRQQHHRADNHGPHVLNLLAVRCMSPQPANLTSMIEFMPKDVKPLEVIVHALPAPKGRLLFKPLVFTPAEFRQRPGTDPVQPAQVIFKLAASNLTPRPLT